MVASCVDGFEDWESRGGMDRILLVIGRQRVLQGCDESSMLLWGWYLTHFRAAASTVGR